MNFNVFQARIIPFGTTLAQWTVDNPTPLQGEFIVEVGATPTDFKFKIGDGLTPYMSLPYQSSGGGGGGGDLQATLDQGSLASDASGGVNDFTLLKNSTSETVNVTPTEINFKDPGGLTTAILESIANGGRIGLLDIPTGRTARITNNNTPTADRALTTPDQDGPLGLEGDSVVCTATIRPGGGSASGGHVVAVLGDSRHGYVNFVTGSSPVSGAPLMDIIYPTPFSSIARLPFTCLQGVDNETFSASYPDLYIDNIGLSGFTIQVKSGVTIPANTSFSFNFLNVR